MLVNFPQAVANDAFSVCGVFCWELHADAGEQGFVTAGVVELGVGEKCEQSVAETLGCVCRCGRWRVSRVEDTAFGCKRVEVRGLDLRMSRTPQVARVPLVGTDEDNVGLGIHGRSSVNSSRSHIAAMRLPPRNARFSRCRLAMFPAPITAMLIDLSLSITAPFYHASDSLDRSVPNFTAYRRSSIYFTV